MNSRQEALLILADVLKNKSYLNLVLKKKLPKDSEDKRFITALVSTTIENLFRIDYVLAQFTSAKRIHTVIRNILRLGACQLMFFEQVPASAAVNESVRLAELNGKRQLKGFVNAILRNLSQNLGSIKYPDPKEDFSEHLHIFYSYPKWLCEKYVADYGRAQAEAIFSHQAEHQKTCIRQNKVVRDEPFLNFEKGKYCDDAFYIKNASSIDNMPTFKRGEFAVQGESSMICVMAAGIKKTDNVLDVCAAPGGKTAYAAQIASEGSVVAMELHEHRSALIENTIQRLKLNNVEIVTADATVFNPKQKDFYDVVLADVPCSALGLLYRKPDIKLWKEEEDIGNLTKIQYAILENCARYVRPGGVLLYSTCTLSKEENSLNIAKFLENNENFAKDDIKNEIPEKLMHRVIDGELQLMPHIDNIDGFYMARLRRL